MIAGKSVEIRMDVLSKTQRPSHLVLKN